MLKVLELSLIGTVICTGVIGGIGANVRKNWNDIKERLGFDLCSFIVEFVWMSGFLYFSCKPFTLITVLMWMWPALLVNILISSVIDSSKEIDNITHFILIAISVIACMTSLFGPVQNLIYIHDMSNTDVSYAVLSKEILAKVEHIDRRKKYDVDFPEIRQVNGEDIAVYHIKHNISENGFDTTEYIPGFGMQKKDELPQIVSKRLYFDTSYFNEKDALRTVRRKYQTVVIGTHKFDIDDNYNPYEIFEYREEPFSTNGKDYGIIVLNLMDGTSEKYPVDEIPSWVDFTTTYPR